MLRIITLLLLSAQMYGQVLELYPNFHTVGVVVDIESLDDPDLDMAVQIRYQVQGSETWVDGFPATRISLTRFAGSLFWLTPGTSYAVSVTFVDPDGGPLDAVVVTDVVTTRSDPAPFSYSQTLVVGPGGSGSTCSQGSPCSLVQALSLVQPGEEILLLDGTYQVGEIDLPRSGTASQPIGLRGESQGAIIDGSSPEILAWAEGSQGVYSATTSLNSIHLAFANGERLYPYQSLNDLQDLIWGLSGFYQSGQTVYVKLVGGLNPNSEDLTVSRFNYALLIEQDWWQVSDLTFQYFGHGDYAKAIYLNNASHNLIENCHFPMNDIGVGIKRDSHQNTIQGCVFQDDTFLWPWDAVKAGSQLETGGVVVFSPMTGRGTVIRNNIFHDYFDGFTCCPEDNGDMTNETDVYENTIYNTGDDGLSADGVCSNVRIWGNTFHDVLVGISLAPILEGPIFAMYNLIYRTGAGNSIYSGYPFKFNVGGQPTSGRMYLFHNTADAYYPGNNGFYVKTPGTWEEIQSLNNIWVGTDYAVNNYNTTQPITMDYDLFFNHGNGDLIRWDGVNHSDLPSFVIATGQNEHGWSDDPGFVDPGSQNYTLTLSSPLRDQGLVIPGINHQFQGSGPEPGAFEILGSLDPDTWRMEQNQAGFPAVFDSDADGMITILDFIASQNNG